VFATLMLSSVASSIPFGGISFLCGLFQGVKLVSLVTGNLEGVLIGAIGGGLACGFGW
jgi:hypothetical protein